jgi:hypothetical protein
MSDLLPSFVDLTLDGVSDGSQNCSVISSGFRSERLFAYLQKAQKSSAQQASFSLRLPWTDSVVGPSSSQLDVRVPSAENIAKDLQWLMSSPVEAGDFQRRLLGVDLETSSEGESVLLQLSTASRY